jgi:hypothetical protein
MAEWWTLATGGVIPSLICRTGSHPRHRPWPKLLAPSSSHGMSKPSYCNSLWPTPLHPAEATGLGTTMFKLPPPMGTSRPLTRCSSLRQESLWKPITGFAWLSPSSGSCACTETQKTLFTAQQLRGDVCTWWANYTATCHTNYQVLWGEFREAFRTHHILAGIMRRKHQEFMDLKQGGRSVHEYSNLFNHLTQYAPE